MLSIPQMIQQAVQLHSAGKFADAEAMYVKVLDRAPNEPAALHLFGVLRHQQGRHAEAADLVRRAVRINPRDGDAHTNLASICRALGDADGAISAGRRAVELIPNTPQAWNNLALGLKMKGQLEEALSALSRAVQLQPNFAQALMNIGNTLCDMGRHEQSIPYYESALRIEPGAAVYYNLGLALHALKRDPEAVEAIQQATRLSPNSAEFLGTLGDAYSAVQRYDEAIQTYRRALQLDPKLVRIYLDLGIAYRESNRIAEAIEAHEQAVATRPDHADCHLNLAFSLLWAGRFDEGWREHEWRWKSKNFTSEPRDFAQPVWDLSIDPRGKRILVHAEQGFGDTLQFARYVPMLAARGAEVIIECQPQLVRLLWTIDGVKQVIARGDPLPEFDLRVAMMSLPYAFGTILHTIPANVPYLCGEKKSIESEPGELKLGLAWAGNPNRQLDQIRSITLSMLAPLTSIPNVTFYSLQKLAGSEQAADPPPGMHLINLTPQLHDFADTAALIEQLDLVITVDTAAAHLAGALGKPVWIMLPFAGGWRWLTDRDDSPWYPTARLFRQPGAGDWNSENADVSNALRSMSNVRC